MINVSDTSARVGTALGSGVVESREEHGWSVAYVDSARWHESCAALHAKLGLDYLASLTAVDLKENLELVAHLVNLADQAKVTLKCRLTPESPSVASVTDIWEGANWHERETHELFGIGFEGHPDLTHLLLPDDWEGYPLRKDYVDPD